MMNQKAKWKLGLVLVGVLALNAGISGSQNARANEEIQKFLQARKPLASSQKILLAKAFFTYLMSRPWAAIRCVSNFVTDSNYGSLNDDPQNFEVFKLLRERTIKPSAEHSFNFTNSDSSFSPVCSLNLGVCQGMTNMDRRANMLVYYDPENTEGQSVPTDPKKLFRFYENKINQVRNGEPVIIPGFRNLKEMSEDAVMGRVLREAVVKVWAKENATLPGIMTVLASIKGTFSKEEARDLYNDLKERVALHYNPIVFLSRSEKEAGRKWIHVLPVHELTEKDANGNYRIGIKDPNRSPTTSYIEVTGEGQASYSGSPLVEVDIMPGDDLEIAQMLTATMEFCKDHPRFCTETEQSPADTIPSPTEI